VTPITPDIPGFIAAADNLRSLFGTATQFLIPVAATWPLGTKINPDTGMPYDATIKATSEPFTTITKTVLIILKQGSPLRPQSDTFWEQVGDVSGMDIIVDISGGDYGEVETASDMEINGLTYKIEEAKPFSVGGSIYRYLVYGKEH
jgi:hypothetical protein